MYSYRDHCGSSKRNHRVTENGTMGRHTSSSPPPVLSDGKRRTIRDRLQGITTAMAWIKDELVGGRERECQGERRRALNTSHLVEQLFHYWSCGKLLFCHSPCINVSLSVCRFRTRPGSVADLCFTAWGCFWEKRRVVDPYCCVLNVPCTAFMLQKRVLVLGPWDVHVHNKWSRAMRYMYIYVHVQSTCPTYIVDSLRFPPSSSLSPPARR